MQIIKNRQVVRDDLIHLADDAPLPQQGSFTVSWERWTASRDELGGRAGLGVRIDGTVEIKALAADLEHFERVVVEFPKFADGRVYSHARLLRDRYGFQGEIRATGDVLRDQLLYMERCGISEFEVRADKDIHDALKGFEDFSVFYQTAADKRPPIYRRDAAVTEAAAE